MRKQRKNSGGYALAYVLVIILVLCAIAMTICTVALRNYQTQARSVAYTRQLYQAEGEIEKFVALAEDVSSLTVSGPCDSGDEAKGAAKAAYKTYLNKLASGYTLTPDTSDSDRESCKFTLTYKNDTVCIETKISMALTYDVKMTTKTLPDGTPETTYTAKVSKASHNYNTYTITHLTAEGGASG